MDIAPLDAVRLLSPRITALITTIGENKKTNASPYSWVFPFSFSPPMVAVGVGRGGKNTQKNAERTKEFVLNLVSKDFGQQACDLERKHGENQLAEAGLHEEKPSKVKTPGIREAKARIECKLHRVIDVPEADHVLLVGEIVAADCDEMKEGKPDLDSMNLLMHVSGNEFREVGKKVLLQRKK